MFSFVTTRILGLAALLGTLALCEPAAAQQSRLPACPSDQNVRWHNCFGTAKYPGGGVYVGEYRDGQRSGKGTFNWPNGDRYVGEYRGDKRDGQGTLTWSDGRKYIGEYKDDRRTGRGTEYSSSSPPPQAATVLTPPPVAQKARSGSAFRIANGQFITNHHVIDGCTTLKVDGKLGARVVSSDPIRDLALVSTTDDRGETAKVRTTRIQLNESVTVAGFPLDGAFSGIAITNGTISRLSGLRGDIGEVQISAPVQPGNSGGPLLDAAGNVIGVVSSKLNALKVAGTSGDIPQNVNFAVTGSALRAFLDAKSVNYDGVADERGLTGVQIAVRASAFTVLIECR